jgi:hypothetical protein
MFVDDHGHMNPALAQHLKKSECSQIVGFEERLAKGRSEIERLALQKVCNQILHSYHAQHPIDLAVTNPVVGIAVTDQFLTMHRGWIAQVEPLDSMSRRNQRSNALVPN